MEMQAIRGFITEVGERINRTCIDMTLRANQGARRAIGAFKGESGQGTTEYAILVGVLVVIAIAAIGLFKPKLEDLWNAIVSGMATL